MLDNCFYNKIKVLHKLSCLQWFLKKHAHDDAKKVDHGECHEFFEKLEKDLGEHVAELKSMVCKKCQ